MAKRSMLSHLLGKARSEDDEEETTAEERDDETTSETEEEETTSEEEEQDPEAEEEDDDPDAEEGEAEPKARRRGRRAAKHRSPVASGFALVKSPEARGREKLAASLGEKVATGKLTFKEATALLSSAPRKSSLAEAMHGRDVNPGASSAPAGGQKKADVQASWDRAFKKVAGFGRQRAA